MLEIMGNRLTSLARSYLPDPFIFAILLTMLTFLLGLIFGSNSIFDLLGFWHGAFFSAGILSFGMQMCLVLVTGFALATSPLLQALIHKLAQIPNTTESGAILVAGVAIITGFINWGLAVIVGALLAREVAISAFRRGIKMHYPLLGAAGYMGLAVWHGGYSGSATLKVAEPGHSLEGILGVISISNSIWSTQNILIGLGLFIWIPILLSWLTPKDTNEFIGVDEVLNLKEGKSKNPDQNREQNFAYKLEESMFITAILVLMGLSYTSFCIYQGKFSLNLNWVNFIFLFTGLALHQTPMRYVRAIQEASSACAGIIIQFPFYSGIMGIMKGSGLAVLVVQGFQAVSSTKTLGVVTFFSASLVNLFVPSGGGQWVIQGPLIMEAARAMQASYEQVLMAFCYGDQWTNLLQPFWALALLGITGLRASQIMGYCMAVMLLGFLYFPICIYLLW